MDKHSFDSCFIRREQDMSDEDVSDESKILLAPIV